MTAGLATTPVIADNIDSESNRITVTAGAVGDGVVLEGSIVTGGSSSSASVTSGPVTVTSGRVYVATVASKSFEPVTALSGLGGSWTLAAAQCGARGQTGVSIFTSVDAITSGAVTAMLAGSANNAVITVAQYSGVDLGDPVGAVNTANTVGETGSCSGGTDTESYSMPLSTTSSSSLVVGAIALGNRTNSPGDGWTEQAHIEQGRGGGTAGLSIFDQHIATSGPIAVAGTVSRKVDWALAAIELTAAVPTPAVPEMVVAPGSLDFGSVLVSGGPSELDVTISNGSGATADLVVSSVGLSAGGPEFAVVAGGGSVVVGPGGVHTVTVRFDPVAVGVFSGSLVVESNDPDSPTVVVPLTGEGTADTPTEVLLEGSIVTGGSSSSASVTSGQVTVIPGRLYVATVASKSYKPVTAVSGLGGTWTLAAAQCGARSQTGVSIFTSVDATTSGAVTAALDGSANNAVITVAQYSGVDLGDPVGAVNTANTVGETGPCTGGTDTASYSMPLTTTSSSSLVVGAIAVRNKTNTPGDGWTEQVHITQGDSGGATAGLSIFDQHVALSGPITVTGTTSNIVDWALAAVELTAASPGPPAPNIVVTPSPLHFGSVPELTTVQTPVTVINTGTLDLEITATAVTGPEFAIVDGAGLPITLAPGQSHDIAIGFTPPSIGSYTGSLTIESNDPDTPTATLALTGSGTTPPNSDGMWISPAELAQKPMSGDAWTSLLETADGALGTADIADLHSKHDIRTLAVALVYARTGDPAYRLKAFDAIVSAVGTDEGASAHDVGRNLSSYIIAADLIDLAQYDPVAETSFRTWLDALRFVERSDGTLIGEDEDRANNHGRYAGASRVAVAIYLGDQVELDRAALVFRGLLGDREAYSGFRYTMDLSWQADPTQPVGINPLGATKDGYSIDGALPEEMRRGCPFQIPPCWTDYGWEGLSGIFVEAVLLERQGYDVFNWQDQAILRAVQFLERLSIDFPSDPWWADGDETFIPWLTNSIYGTDFPTSPVQFGDNMGFTDWTHGPDGP
ncbi:MAG: choice-of-anchor D domain-containing protein [Acidimicrobiia bacterium]|nr:choice-of-anchor D domain-containing protein [Acidimicrobiia bacterium]